MSFQANIRRAKVDGDSDLGFLQNLPDLHLDFTHTHAISLTRGVEPKSYMDSTGQKVAPYYTMISVAQNGNTILRVLTLSWIVPCNALPAWCSEPKTY